MSSHFVMSAMCVVEMAVWASLALVLWHKRIYRRFPSMASYVALHAVATPLLSAVLYLQEKPWAHHLYKVYFFGNFAVYILSATLLFFVCLEVFRSALSGLPGLMKVGVVIFRWAIIVSLVLAFTSVQWKHRGIQALPDIAYGLIRSVSILEICLLAFLCLSMNALRLSIRDLAFGISLGFGIMASNDLISATLISAHSTLTAPLQIVYEAVILLSLGIWVTYSAMPQTLRKPMMMPANSTIFRWNEIASALGHTGTQIAVQQHASSFFLTDVEKVVEKVLTKNLKERKQEL